MRKLAYAQAINETLHQLMESNKDIFLMGQGVTSPWYVGSTTVGLAQRFGTKRVIDTPVSENVVTGACLGAALAGKHPILMHPRMDFMYYAFDQLANQIATWKYMFGGQFDVPIVIWAIINRGGEQSAQHSQAIQAIFTHLSSFKVVMPSTPYDVKGLLVSSVNDNGPVMFIDDRWNYGMSQNVPEKLYSIPLGKGKIRNHGKDVTVVATSFMVSEAIKAAEDFSKDRISVEVIEPRSIKPLDENMILTSVSKTGRLVIADAAWKTCGFGAEVAALVAEKALQVLKSPIVRVSLPDCPAPASSCLEKEYYPTSKNIIEAIEQTLR